MKRLLALILSVVLTAACFIACADPEKKPGYDPSLEEGSLGIKYTDGGAFKKEPPHHEHTKEITQHEAGHDWSYTCGCMTPPNFALHSDGDGDGKCDGCDYPMGESTAP